MKKIALLIIAVVACVLTSSAEIYNFTAYSYYEKKSGGSYVKQGSCDIPIILNTDNNTITIESKRHQKYSIVECLDAYFDDDGDEILKMRCKDEEGIKCTVRLIDSSGDMQLYVDYSNISWAYEIE